MWSDGVERQDYVEPEWHKCWREQQAWQRQNEILDLRVQNCRLRDELEEKHIVLMIQTSFDFKEFKPQVKVMAASR